MTLETEHADAGDFNKEVWGPCECCCAEGKPCRACGQLFKGCCFGLGCYCCCTDFGEKEWFEHVEKENRFCTDVPCCLIMLAALIIQFSLFIEAATGTANPRRLTHLSDYEGKLCHPRSGDDGKYTAWPDIRMVKIRICVNDCDDTETDSRMVTPAFSTDLNEDYTLEEAQNLGGYRTRTFLSLCLPKAENSSEFVSASLKEDYDKFNRASDNLSDALERGVGDLVLAWPLLLGSAFGAMVLSLLYTKALQKIADVLVWVSIVLIFVGLLVLGIFLINGSERAYEFGYDKLGDMMYAFGVIAIIVDVIYSIAICFSVSRIILAVTIAKEATRAMADCWTLIFFPIIPAVTLIGFFSYWIFTTACFASVTVKTTREWPSGVNTPYFDGGRTLAQTLNITSDEYDTREFSTEYQNAILYNIFILFWVTAFIGYASYMAITGVYAEWYFSDWEDSSQTHKKKGRKPNELSPTPVTEWFYRVVRFHFGSIAVASFAVALVQWLDFMLTYAERTMLDQEPSQAQKIVLAVIHCLLKCLQCVIDRINKHGIIITAIHGWPFCPASMKGLELVFKNIIRSGAMSMVSGYLIRIGQATICALNGAITVAIALSVYGDDLSAPWAIIILAIFISITISTPYLALFEVAVDTLFICFLIDEEKNKGSGHMRASDRLKVVINEETKPTQKVIRRAQATRKIKMQFGELGRTDTLDADPADGAAE